jgi:hypothetical protein
MQIIIIITIIQFKLKHRDKAQYIFMMHQIQTYRIRHIMLMLKITVYTIEVVIIIITY